MTATASAPIEVTADLLAKWATDPAGPVALTMKQKLLPVTATDDEPGIIYPPTYADIGYCIDTLSDDTKVALIDSVGSQANRMEPIFKRTFKANVENQQNDVHLVPQIEIVLHDNEKRSLLDLAHRSADAVVWSCKAEKGQNGGLNEQMKEAFAALRKGDAGPLCRLAPTSLIFGVWDSRGGSGEKRPRLVRSIIRAWDVDELHSAAQFNSVWKALDEKQQDELKKAAKTARVKLSVKGFADAPAVMSKSTGARVLGGILVRGRIEREVTVNMLALRNIHGECDDTTKKIRKYLLGLALVVATEEIDLFLREGCHLRCAEKQDTWYAIPRRGSHEVVGLGNAMARDVIIKYTLEAAETYLKSEDPQKSGWPPKISQFKFDLKAAMDLLKKPDEVDPDEDKK
jgi:CRISPR-associated protein Csb1